MIIRKEKIDESTNFNLTVSSNINKYKFLEEIGKGTYGIVYKGQEKRTKEFVAIKEFIYKNQLLHITTVRELRNLSKIGSKSKHIAELLEMVISVDKVYGVFKFYPKMLNELKFVNLSAVKKVMRQILEGVKEIHANKIVHRDLKPGNIMWSHEDDCIKIIDLGMSKKVSGLMTVDVVTLVYRAPELFIANDTMMAYGYDIDIWSLGIIFLELLSGKPLFNVDSTEIKHLKLLERYFKTNFLETFNFIKNKKLLDFLDGLLKWNSIERTTASEALEHEFLNEDTSEALPAFPSNIFE